MRAAAAAPPRLEARGLGWEGWLNDISFRVHAGEVVGLGGLDGQGQRELLLALFGVLRGTTGEVSIDGVPVAIAGPRDAKHKGIGMALIPEDRKTEGLMLPMSVRDNLSFAALDTLSRWGDDAIAERERDHRAPAGVQPTVFTCRPARCPGQPAEARDAWLDVTHLTVERPRGVSTWETKQEIYQLLHHLALGGDPVLFDDVTSPRLRPRARDGRRRHPAATGAETMEHALAGVR
jgi:ribose transport system ATP-binding protein